MLALLALNLIFRQAALLTTIMKHNLCHMIYTTVGSLVKFFCFNKSKIMRTADWRIKPLHLVSFAYDLTVPIGAIKISRYFFSILVRFPILTGGLSTISSVYVPSGQHSLLAGPSKFGKILISDVFGSSSTCSQIRHLRLFM